MAELKNNIFNNNIAGDTSNILIPDSSAIKSGIAFKSNINSNVLNGFYNILSEAIQYLQFTVGLYNKEANYNEGNIASLVIKTSENYSIWQFRRNSNNPQVLNNNHPITGASITTVNGIDIYEGGTLNTDWDKLTENYDIEAVPNTVIIRDEVGASNVNTPSNIKNTTVINNEYLQTELAKKQNNLIAGTNVEITENNVINVKGDVATTANQVTQTNEALGANVQTALDILFKRYNIPLYFIVYPEDDGTFDDKKRPANYFKKLYNLTTVWKKRFATTGAFIRFEGDFADEDRDGLIQYYATKRMYGKTGIMGGGSSGAIFDTNLKNSVLFHQETFYNKLYNFIDASTFRTATSIIFDNLGFDGTNKNISNNEGRSTNIKVELYELVSINGINIWEE